MVQYISSAMTDIGIKKKVNQDSVIIKTADTDYGPVLFAAVCDGMGGMTDGEYASATIVKGISHWFENYLPDIIYENKGYIDRKHLYRSLNSLIKGMNERIAKHGEETGGACGSTLAGILLINNNFYCINIGDSRVYVFHKGLKQLTKDQTYVQHEIDAGRMTIEEAKKHPNRSVLLQCIGAGNTVVPVFSNGLCGDGDLFMICSDGFRHKIKKDEFERIIVPEELSSRKDMESISSYCIELNKERKETDNISVVFVKIEER